MAYQNKYKICGKCGRKKKREEFFARKELKDGLFSWCKECLRNYDKKRYLDQRREKIAITREWKKNNRDRERAQWQRHYWRRVREEFIDRPSEIKVEEEEW